MKLFWTLEIAVIFTLQTAYLYPQTGVYLGLKEGELFKENEWTDIKDWEVNENNDKRWFKEDINFISPSGFVAPRSGLYYVSLYLEFKNPRAGQYYMNVTVTKNDNSQKKEHYSTKSTSDKEIAHVQVDDLLLIDKNDTIRIFLWSSNRYNLTTNSRIFLQFINSYQNIIGFVAHPSLDSSVSVGNPQVLVGWNTKFDIVNGFSKTTGNYVIVLDGYYLISFKLLFAKVSGLLRVQLYVNNDKFCDIEKKVIGENEWETLTYVDVRKLTAKTKISLRLYSFSKSSYISTDSSYSIIFLASEGKFNIGVRHFRLKTNTRIKSDNYQIGNWDSRDSDIILNDEFRVPKSGYYLITLNAYVQKRQYSPAVRLKLKLNSHHTVESVYSDGESTRFSLSGIFFVNQKDNFYFSIEAKEDYTLLKKTTVSLYEITYETHTHLYNLRHGEVGKNLASYDNKKKHVLQITQSHGSNEFLMLTTQNIKVVKSGIYYFVLNLFLGNSTNHNLEISLMHRNTEGDWNLMSSCYVFYSSNCYIPITLLLNENEEIAIWKSANTNYHEDLSASFFLIQFLKNIDTKRLSPNVKYRRDKGYSTADRTERNNLSIVTRLEGVYLITFNVIVRTHEAFKSLKRIAKIILKNDDNTILEIERKIIDTAFMNIFCTRTQYLENNTRLHIEIIMSSENDNVTWTVDKDSHFSILLTTLDKTKYFEVDARVEYGVELTSGEMRFKLTPSFSGKDYVNYHYTLEASRSFFALLTVTLIGEGCPSPGANYMKLSVILKNNKRSWDHMSAEKYITSQPNDECPIVTLQISGMVIFHRGDMFEVVPILSKGLRFTPRVGSSLSLVVVKEEAADIPSSYFTPTPLTFQQAPNDVEEKEVSVTHGVYEIFLKIESQSINTQLDRYRRDIKVTDGTPSSDPPINSTLYFSDTSSWNNSTTSSPAHNTTMFKYGNITTLPVTTTNRPTTTAKKIDPCRIFLVRSDLSDEKSISSRLRSSLDNIWNSNGDDFNATLNQITCVNCEHEIILAAALNRNSTFSIKEKKCESIKSSISVKKISEKGDQLMYIRKEQDENVCSGTGFRVIDGWSRNGELSVEGVIYKATNYEIVHTYINIFTRQVNKTRLILATNGLVEDAETLTLVDYSENLFLYKLYLRRLMKRHHTLQVFVDCSNGPVTVLSTSSINIFKKDKLMRMIKDSFPIFIQPPSPTFVNKSMPLNFTCALEKSSTLNYYWNKIDMHTSVWTNFSQPSRPFQIEGEPEESGYYFCSATDSGYEVESDKAIVDISDINECELMKNASNGIRRCHSDAECVNTVGSHYCKCEDGYKGDGYVCNDINECDDKGLCGNDTICTNYKGTFNCSCKDNYHNLTMGKGCIDINECLDTERCSRELNIDNNITYCVNYPGSYECKCIKGYMKKDGTCKDVDECKSDPDKYPCHSRASCNNTIGSYYCFCDPGYFGDGKMCEDIDECSNVTLYSCPGNSSCENNNGSYRCVCDSGFRQITPEKMIRCESLGCFPPHFCAGQYRISWWSRKPYIENSSIGEGSATGLFREILSIMIEEICNNCSRLSFDLPRNGSYQLEGLVEKNSTDLACPLYGSKEQEKFRGFPFIPIVEAPGVAFFVKDQATSSSPLVGSLAGSWPILVVTLLLASLSGVIIWFLDTVRNPSEFPHSFIEGSWEGFWWAFITMTTVGYGDKAPRSFFARAFGIIWILIGLVIISTFTATITTVLTASSLSNEAKLYGTKVGALQNSEEFRLGVKRNADVTGYSSVPAIIDALNEGKIQGALLDTYIAGEFQDQLQEYKLQEILEHVFVYGVVLARDAERLEKELRTFLERKQSKIYSIISRVVKPLKENKASKAASSQSGALFDEDSPFFRTILIAGSVVLGMLLLIGFLWDRCYWRRQREKEKRRNLSNEGCTNERTLTHQSWKTCDVIEYQKHAFKAEVLDLKQQISDFANVWVTRLDEMEGTHEQKLSRVQKWLGRSSASSRANSLLPNGSSRTKPNGVRGLLPDTEEQAV